MVFQDGSIVFINGFRGSKYYRAATSFSKLFLLTSFVYFNIVQCYFDMGDICINSNSPYHIKRYQRLRNRAIRIILGKKRSDRTPSDLLCKLASTIENLCDRIHYNRLHPILNNFSINKNSELPNFNSLMNLRNPIFLPHVNTESGRRNILFRASKIINVLFVTNTTWLYQ